jgi:rod shape determining protein RodA
MFSKRFWKNFDFTLFAVTALLTIVGILILYSISFKASTAITPTDARNQIIFAIIALAAFFMAARTDYRTWQRLAPWLYLATVASLGVVMLVGRSALGATRWINLGFFQFQPAELTKLILIIVLAKFYADHYDEMNKPKYLILSLVYTVIPMALVLAQPDLGTALVLGAIWLAMALVSRVRKWHLLVLLILGGLTLPLTFYHLQPYQQARLTTFLNPTADPLGTGYNVNQAIVAVGSGQVFGRGLGAGSQSQLNFLPSQDTDFIFAVLTEKLGFIGGMLLLVLFAVLLFRGLIIAMRSQDRFGMFLAVGIVAMLLFHVFINVGMNMGIMPVTGIPLPFISYGGTSLLIGMVAVGLLESVAVRRKKLEFGT